MAVSPHAPHPGSTNDLAVNSAGGAVGRRGGGQSTRSVNHEDTCSVNTLQKHLGATASRQEVISAVWFSRVMRKAVP